MNQTAKGSMSYLISIVLVAVLGGLLFGYDTAVISGAEKGLQAFFIGASDFTYTDAWHGFTCASALIGCIIGSAMYLAFVRLEVSDVIAIPVVTVFIFTMRMLATKYHWNLPKAW